MALPAGLPTSTVTFGDYPDAAGTPSLIGLRAQIVPVDSTSHKPIRVLHVATGTAIVPVPVEVVIGSEAIATAGPLARSGSGLTSPDNFLYRCTWHKADGGSLASWDPSPGDKVFALPIDSLDVVDYDKLGVATSAPGVLVPIGVGPGVAPGGTTGQVLVKASGADYDTAWAAGATPGPGGGSATTDASALISGTLDPARIADGSLTAAKMAADVATQAEMEAASTADRARANHTGTQSSATISDFTEAVQDAVGALLGAGSNVVVNYDDASNSLTISSTATGGTGLDAEQVRDAIGVALVGIGPIAVAVNDELDTITISTTATANSTDAALRDRSTHTGTQAATTITGLAPVATSGAYADLSGKPNIPAALTVQEEGAALAQRAAINFVGAGVTATDDAAGGRIVVTVPGGVGGGSATGVPTVVNVRDAPYNAKADGKDITDAAITTGTATLTSATAAFTTGDVGKLVYVYGAGASGALLATTIAAWVSATQVTLTANAATTVTGARATYGSDDTAAWTAAINAAKVPTAPGIVSLDRGLSLVTAAMPALVNTRDVTIRGGGAGSMSYGGHSGNTIPKRPRTELRYMGSGSGVFLPANQCKGFAVEDIGITYGHPAYTGTLINLDFTWNTKFQDALFGGAVLPAFGATLFSMSNQVEAMFVDCLFERATLGFQGGGFTNANTWTNCVFLGLRKLADKLLYQNTFVGSVFEPGDDSAGGDPLITTSAITGAADALAFYGCGWWDATTGYWIDVTGMGVTISGGFWEPQGGAAEGLIRVNGASDGYSIGGGFRARGVFVGGAKLITMAAGATITNLDLGSIAYSGGVTSGLEAAPVDQAVTFMPTRGAASYVDLGGVTAAVTLRRAAVQRVTLTGSNCTVTLPTVGSTAETRIELRVTQGLSGGPHTVTWPTSIWWPSGAPTLSTAAGAVDTIMLSTTDGVQWLGRLVSTHVPQVPGAPTLLTAIPNDGRVALSWTTPAGNGGVITDYVVQYRTTAGPGAWTTFADGTSASTGATVTGLTNGTPDDFRVAGVNVAGTGAYSNTLSATPAVPGGPFALSSIMWRAAYWSEDSALGTPANGAAITSWPDYSGQGLAAATHNVAPIYTASQASLGGRPTVDFDEALKQALRTAGTLTQAQTLSVVAVLADWTVGGGTNQGVLVGTDVISGIQILAGTTSIAGMYAGSAIARPSPTQPSTGAHAWCFVVAGASSKIVKDGTSATVTATPGTAGYAGKVSIGNRGGAENSNAGLFGTSKIAFLGIYAGDITTDPLYADLKTYIASHYGLTLA